MKPELMEALQVLKFSLKKDRLNFTAQLQFPEHPSTSDGGRSTMLMEMLTMEPHALKTFLDAADLDD
jgi:hypothetical protein